MKQKKNRALCKSELLQRALSFSEVRSMCPAASGIKR